MPQWNSLVCILTQKSVKSILPSIKRIKMRKLRRSHHSSWLSSLCLPALSMAEHWADWWGERGERSRVTTASNPRHGIVMLHPQRHHTTPHRPPRHPVSSLVGTGISVSFKVSFLVFLVSYSQRKWVVATETKCGISFLTLKYLPYKSLCDPCPVSKLWHRPHFFLMEGLSM